ncbi:MAG: hypothetical protein Q8P40_09150, partial [Nitrospirota bacterium]|nr:hypothetical protein [Nitrospirota bacterium]
MLTKTTKLRYIILILGIFTLTKVYSQTVNIKDYFPTVQGVELTYRLEYDSLKTTMDTQFVKHEFVDNINNVAVFLTAYHGENITKMAFKGGERYEIKNNVVYNTVSTTFNIIAGEQTTYHDYNNIILKEAGSNWVNITGYGKKEVCTAVKDSIGKFKDCIKVIKKVFEKKGKVYKYDCQDVYYYARNFGLVKAKSGQNMLRSTRTLADTELGILQAAPVLKAGDQPGLKAGDPAPPIVLKNLDGGSTFYLRDYCGQPRTPRTRQERD